MAGEWVGSTREKPRQDAQLPGPLLSEEEGTALTGERPR